MYRQIIFAAVLIFTTSCAVQGVNHGALAGNTLSARSVLETSPLASLAGSETDLSSFDMLDVSPEMAAFLDEKVDSNDGQNEQLKQLAWAIMRSGEFSLVYDDLTGTATETFNRRRGNCMAFTNMFIAMARELGLDARFQEVDVPPNWSMSRGSFLYSQHINVFIDLKQGRTREVDFNIYDFDHELDSRIISDDRARAHYFNNIGAEQMLNGETGLAYAQFRHSLLHDASYAPAWINMGILHRREGQADFAEVSFLEALRHDATPQLDVSRLTRDAGWLPPRQDDNSLVAMSNLANLYEEQGETELARGYFDKVHSHRMKNPYYRYQMAELAFEEGDYEAAIGDLKYAIRRRKNENEFYYLLSLSYLMDGDREEALEWMQKAEDVAQLNSEKERYSHKLDLLQSLDKN
ncbi:MAG: tetratricopeptide repeat protein [Xanthomonadales bacterium]|nr:tetratricopeptide repeat protein [Xanthomonadales bacterium]